MVVLVCNVEIQFYFIFEYCILIAKDFIPQLAAYNSIHQKLSENCLPTRPLSTLRPMLMVESSAARRAHLDSCERFALRSELIIKFNAAQRKAALAF